MIAIETASVRAVFDLEQGTLRQLTDVPRGHDYLIDAPVVPLIEFEVVLSDRRQVRMTPSGPATVARQGPSMLSLRWERAAGEGLDVAIACQIDAQALGEQIHWRLSVTNGSGGTITSVCVPCIGPIGVVESPQTDRLRTTNHVEPEVPLWVDLAEPVTGAQDLYGPWKTRRRVEGVFPTSACMTPWADLGGPTLGMILDIQDFRPEQQALLAERALGNPTDPASVYWRWTWQSHPHLAPGDEWQSPTTSLILRGDDWRQSARQHRRALAKQLPLVEPPRNLNTCMGWLRLTLRDADGRDHLTYDQLVPIGEKAVELGLAYLILSGWHDSNVDALYPDYRPVAEWGGADGLRAAADHLETIGVHVVLSMNPTIWDVHSQGFAEMGDTCRARNLRGVSRREYRGAGPFRHNEFCVICPCADVNRFHLDLARQWLEQYGIHGIHLAQIGQRAFSCHDPSHGHARPQRASVDGHQEFLSELHQLIRRADPDGIVTAEGTSALHGRWVDAAWTPYYLNGVEWIQLACANASGSTFVLPGQLDMINRAFLHRTLLDVRDLSLLDDPPTSDHLRKLRRLKQRFGSAMASAKYEGLVTTDNPAVLACAYGKDLIVLANLADAAQRCRCLKRSLTDWFVHALSGADVEPTAHGGLTLFPWEVLVVERAPSDRIY